jgi:hypothetical protein
MFDNLKIFKGTDHVLDTTVDQNGVLKTSVYLDEVSTGLYESATLFFLEDVEYNSVRYLNRPLSDTQTAGEFVFKWKNDSYSSGDLIMYTAKVENGLTKINVETNQQISILDNSTVTGTNNGVKQVSSVNNEAVQVNVALNSEDEGRHENTLLVYYNDGTTSTLIASIFFYGEVVGEDERLRVLLQNLGASLDEGDFILFKEHDITEMAPDYILLNQKRRELLLELANIKPFIGTYKAILNAIDFFGYNNLTLKEYWLNINTGSSSFGKLHAIPVAGSSQYGDAVRKKISVEVPSSNLKKTSRFSLVYRLNVVNGEYDEWDYPKVEEVFEFTPEEVLIKLYGLKSKLQREYLPLNAKIIDIVAEGDYFTQKNLSIWNNQNPIAFFTEGHDIDFELFPTQRKLFIEDVSLVLKKVYDPNNIASGDYQKYHDLLATDFSEYGNLTNDQLADLREAIELFYAGYYNDELETFNEDIEIGCPVILDGETTFTQSWEEAQFTWQDAIDPQVTWNNWWKRWVYEVEWIITGPKGLRYEFKGDIDNYLRFPVFLPYEGSYNVEMRTFDLFGHRSYDVKYGLIEVGLKEVEFYGFYKTFRKNTWNDREAVSWKEVGGYWDLPVHNPNKIEESNASWYLALDRNNYVHDTIEGQSDDFTTVSRYVDIFSETGYSETTGPYYWNNADYTWNNTSDLWWNATRIGSDLAASFKIEPVFTGSPVISIDYKDPITGQIISDSYQITSTNPGANTNIAAWQDVVDELNTSTNPIISKFIYNLVGKDNNGDGVVDVVAFILAVGKETNKYHDFESVSMLGGTISGEVHQITYNPNYDEIDIFSDWRTVNKSTHVTFSPDYSKMPGMKLKKWTITNNTYPDNSDIYYGDIVLTYLFRNPGNYTISLEVEDTNGNVNSTHRNILTVK